MPTALETKLLVRRLSRVKPWWTINFRIQFNERIFGRSEGSLLANFWDLWGREGTWDYWGYAVRMWGHLAHGVWPDLSRVSPDVTPVYPQLISFLIVLARIGETRESNTEFALENEEHEVARRIRDAEDDTAGLPCALSRHKGGTKLEEKGRLAVG